MKFLKVELGMAPPRTYTYGYAGTEEVERGDYVVVPPNSYNPNPAIGRVLRTMNAPDFTGTLTVLHQKASTEVRQVTTRQGSTITQPVEEDDVL